MHQMITKLLITALSLVFFVFCTTSPDQDGEGDENSPEKKALEEAKIEMEVGRGMAGRLLTFYGNYEDPNLVAYLNQIGSYVASYSEFPSRRYMFEVLDSENVNAFACPGGYILITLGALKHARNEAEIAHILGHEIAHVGRKHMFDTLRKMSDEDIEKTNEEMQAKLNIPDSIKARKRPEGEKNKLMEFLGKYLGGSSSMALNVVATAKAGMALMLEKGLGAELEFEADEIGVSNAINAGYHPKALLNFLCRLEQKKNKITSKRCKIVKQKKKRKSDSILDKTHPPAIERVTNIQKTIKKMGIDPTFGAKGKARYKKIVIDRTIKAH